MPATRLHDEDWTDRRTAERRSMLTDRVEDAIRWHMADRRRIDRRGEQERTQAELRGYGMVV